MPAKNCSVTQLPKFSSVSVEQIEPQLERHLSEFRANIDALLDKGLAPEWQNFVAPIEEWNDQLEKFWSPVSHLNAVKNSEALRDAYNTCLPKLTEFSTEMGQHRGLYKAYQAIADSPGYSELTAPRKKVINNALRDFKLSGIGLEDDAKQRFGEIKKRLAELSTQFSNNVLDATQGWFKHVEDEQQLSGVPSSTLGAYRQAAVVKELPGFVVGLDIPAYLPLMQYCDNAELRREMYLAYSSRASEQGPNGGQWDNSELMTEIIALRHELASLLGFGNYAEYSLATKMAENSQQVLGFLNDLASKSRAHAEQDYRELQVFATSLGIESLQAWDVPYTSEKLRLEKYALSQEELRPYFPAEYVIAGMFEVVGRLFAVEFSQQKDFDSWHPDVKLFQVLQEGVVIAEFYLDIYARENKRGGAWMADCVSRRRKQQGELQLPVAFLTCNFTAPSEQLPSLLTHVEVTTLFHEFGHGLHHMLTQIDCAAVSGINAVPWDAVELPSQFLKNWCWEKEAIPLISKHYQSGEELPEALLEKMLAAKNFQSGLQMMRQLEFSLFDIKLHLDYQAENPQPIQETLDSVREQVAVYPVPASNQFQHSFGHIFAGGYAAGYYSYKWAEVLSADAFSRFEEEGVFNAETGASFLHEILQRGGAEEPMVLFNAFRGREPSVDALLRHCGLQ